MERMEEAGTFDERCRAATPPGRSAVKADDVSAWMRGHWRM
jgi:hypothetical protein